MDPRQIDIYQLGVLLCRLVTGQPVSAYLSSPRIKSNVPPQIQSLIDRALGYEPEMRFRRVEDLLAAIEQTCQNLGVQDDLAEPEWQPDLAPSDHEAGTDGKSPQDTSSSIAVADSQPDTDIDPPRNVPRPTDDELPFETLGHFRIVGRIGHGGMGDVYKGYEEALDRTVAIKVLPRDLVRQEQFVRRFRAEATAAAGITHPNVVRIHFIGEDQGHHFFAMQFVDGESLRDRLQRCGRLKPKEALVVIEQVISGLAAAHRRGIVHRDVKPGNILLERGTGRALLADFGLVKSIECGTRMTATGVVMGTVDYISPEQGRGLNVDARSDLYSIGALAYHMLSGNLPFQADSPTAMIFQHVYEMPEPLSEAAPDLPNLLCKLVHRLLAKSPEDRYQNAEDVLADLRAFRTGHLPQPAGGKSADTEDLPVVAPAMRPRTLVIQAPTIDEAPLLPYELDAETPPNRWQRAGHRLLDLARRRSPQFVQRLQNTQQQLDGAVVEYAFRHSGLQQLVSEAEAVLQELKRQREECRLGAVEAERRAESSIDSSDVQDALEETAACQQAVDGLVEQIAEQEEQLDEMRLRLAKVGATLQKARSQRDALNARLKVAQVQVGSASAEAKRKVPTTVFRLAVVAAAALVVFAAFRFWPVRSTSSPPRTAPAPSSVEPTRPSAEATSSVPDTTQRDSGEWGVRPGQPAGTIPVIDYPLQSHPEGADRFGDHWYKVVLGRMMWATAHAKCKEMGGYLACITTREENTFLTRLHPQGHLWIGGVRRYADWEWINGERMGYVNWASGEPNNAGYRELFLKNDEYGSWYDVPGDDGHIQGFVCEWEK